MPALWDTDAPPPKCPPCLNGRHGGSEFFDCWHRDDYYSVMACDCACHEDAA